MERVRYEKNPIYEAILQIQFPPILSINANEPVSFQEKIRSPFPIYQLEINNQQEITLSPVGNTTIPSIKQKRQIKNHNFISKDGSHKINLTQDFISISTKNYTVWEDLIDLFRPVLDSFVEIYSPSFYSRIGLRYTDVFSKEYLGLKDSKWRDLIKPPYSGVFSLASEESVINSTSDYIWFLNDNKSNVRVRTGLARAIPNEEPRFVIDSDFSRSGNIETDQFSDIVSYLHNEAGKFISTAISDELKAAMKPEVIGQYE